MRLEEFGEGRGISRRRTTESGEILVFPFTILGSYHRNLNCARLLSGDKENPDRPKILVRKAPCEPVGCSVSGRVLWGHPGGIRANRAPYERVLKVPYERVLPEARKPS